MYKEGDLTHFNQRLDQFTINRCWEECMHISDFNKRKDAVEQYNSIADPSQQLGSVESFFTAETVAWPWQISCSTGMFYITVVFKYFPRATTSRVKFQP